MKKLLSLTCLLLLIASPSLQAAGLVGDNQAIYSQIVSHQYALGMVAGISLRERGMPKFISKNITNNFVLDGTDVTALAASCLVSSIITPSLFLGNDNSKQFSHDNPAANIIGGAIGTYTGHKLVTGSVFMLNWCFQRTLSKDLFNTEEYADGIESIKFAAGIIGSTVGYAVASNYMNEKTMFNKQ